MDWGIKARELEKVFHELKRDKSVKAVVFRVDSPGGEGLASDVVAESMRKCAREKPVLVSQGNVAASGGYHLSMYADTIMAAPNTVTGSIGVLGGWLWNKELGLKLGMTTDHVKVGDHADVDHGIWLPFLGLQLPDRKLTPQERTRFEELIRDAYRLFVTKVAQGRGLTEAQVDSVAQGRVWSGLGGREAGLVDEIGGLDRTIRIAREAAGIGPEEEIEIIEMPQGGLFKLDLGGPRILSLNMEKDPTWQYLKLFSQHPGQPLPVLPPEMYVE
jgi:protease-4